MSWSNNMELMIGALFGLVLQCVVLCRILEWGPQYLNAVLIKDKFNMHARVVHFNPSINL